MSLSSWTDNPKMAKRFAEGFVKKHNDAHAVVTASIARSHIVASYRTGMIYLVGREDEIIVASDGTIDIEQAEVFES